VVAPVERGGGHLLKRFARVRGPEVFAPQLPQRRGVVRFDGPGEAGLGGLVFGALDEEVGGDAEGVGEALEGVAGGTRLAALVAADVVVVQIDQGAEKAKDYVDDLDDED